MAAMINVFASLKSLECHFRVRLLGSLGSKDGEPAMPLKIGYPSDTLDHTVELLR